MLFASILRRMKSGFNINDSNSNQEAAGQATSEPASTDLRTERHIYERND